MPISYPAAWPDCSRALEFADACAMGLSAKFWCLPCNAFLFCAQSTYIEEDKSWVGDYFDMADAGEEGMLDRMSPWLLRIGEGCTLPLKPSPVLVYGAGPKRIQVLCLSVMPVTVVLAPL